VEIDPATAGLAGSLVTVLVAALVGSLHCVSMCGGFVALYAAGGDGGAGGAGRFAHLAYNGGRLLSYALIGALAGLAGGRLDMAGEWIGVQRAAAILMGAGLIVFGLFAMFGLKRVRTLVTIEEPGARRGPIRRALATLYRRRDAPAALVVGLLSALLPCGWLWGFVAAAGATADPLTGVALMAAFWAGTVPALASLGLLARTLASRLRVHAPALTGVAMILVGVLALTGRITPIVHARAADGAAAHTVAPPCQTPAEP
jgi:sulfite exporter TauE/SafE